MAAIDRSDDSRYFACLENQRLYWQLGDGSLAKKLPCPAPGKARVPASGRCREWLRHQDQSDPRYSSRSLENPETTKPQKKNQGLRLQRGDGASRSCLRQIISRNALQETNEDFN